MIDIILLDEFVVLETKYITLKLNFTTKITSNLNSLNQLSLASILVSIFCTYLTSTSLILLDFYSYLIIIVF